MASATATRSGKSPRAFFRCVLLGGLLVAAVIVGLLAMHTLNLHGTPAAHAPAVVSASVVDAGAAHHGAVGDHEPNGALGDPGASCADCGAGDHLGMAMACVLALLLVLLVLLPPRLLPGWMRTVPRPLLVWRGIDRQVSRAPLLHVLCISRT